MKKSQENGTEEKIEVAGNRKKEDTTLNKIQKEETSKETVTSDTIQKETVENESVEEQKQQVLIKIIDGVTHKLKIPPPFWITDNGQILYRNKDEEICRLSHLPVIPTAVIHNLDSSEEKLELALYKKRRMEKRNFPKKSGIWKSFRISKLWDTYK